MKRKKVLGMLSIVVAFAMAVLILFPAHAAVSAPTIYGTNEVPGREDFDVYLCIGQSNMSGRGFIEAQDQVSIPNTLLWNGSKWETAQVNHPGMTQGLNRYNNQGESPSSSRLNPAFYFSKTMSEKYPDRTIGIVSDAIGATPLSRWESTGDLYANAVSMLHNALAQGGTLRGILWHQGEQDARDGTSMSTYLARLNTTVDRLRTEFGVSAIDCPFIAGELNYEWVTFNSVTFNSTILPAFVSSGRKTDYVSAAIDPENPQLGGLMGRADISLGDADMVHFNSASQRELGRRYAEKMFAMQGGVIQTPITIQDSLVASSGTITITRYSGGNTFTIDGVSGISNSQHFSLANDIIKLDSLSGARKVVVTDTATVPVNIVLNSVNLSSDGPVKIINGGDAILSVRGTNTITSNGAIAAQSYAGIQVETGNKVTITSGNMGTLNISGAAFPGTSAAASAAAAIGGSSGETAGTIVVKGSVRLNAIVPDSTATNVGAAAIGGGGLTSTSPRGGNGGNITIEGNALVSTTTNSFASSLGGGIGKYGTIFAPGDGGSTTIRGNATVTAKNANGLGTAIGGSCVGSGGNITIEGNATVDASGSTNSAVIGSGSQYVNYERQDLNGGNITIRGNANVYAASNGTTNGGAAIGGGCGAASGNITIEGGTVVALAGTASGSAGIGEGNCFPFTTPSAYRDKNYGGNINITGGTVIARGGVNSGSAIGNSGESSSYSVTPLNITITGGSIYPLTSTNAFSPIVPQPKNGVAYGNQPLYMLTTTVTDNGALVPNATVTVPVAAGYTYNALTGKNLTAPFPTTYNTTINSKAFVWLPAEAFEMHATDSVNFTVKEGAVEANNTGTFNIDFFLDLDDLQNTTVIKDDDVAPNGTITITRHSGGDTFTIDGVSGILNTQHFSLASDVVELRAISGQRKVVITGTSTIPVSMVLNSITLLSDGPVKVINGGDAIFNIIGANIITSNGATAAQSYAGIQVETGNKVTITSARSGTLNVFGTGFSTSTVAASAAAAIGGSAGETAGTIVINGNVIVDASVPTSLTSFVGAAAIGGGGLTSTSPRAGNGGNVTIEGNAVVSTTTNSSASSLGGGWGRNSTALLTPGDGGTLLVRGSAALTSVHSTGMGAAIGGSTLGCGGNITIEGNATVEASGSTNSATIGSGCQNQGYAARNDLTGGNITIRGNANVYARNNGAGNGAAAIGGGCGSAAGNITIEGGTVVALLTANSSRSAAIGEGSLFPITATPTYFKTDGGNINITGGTVIAKASTGLEGGNPSSAIGRCATASAYSPMVAVNVTITGGSIYPLTSTNAFAPIVPQPKNGTAYGNQPLYMLTTTVTDNGTLVPNATVTVPVTAGYTYSAVTGKNLIEPLPTTYNTAINGKAFMWLPAEAFEMHATDSVNFRIKDGTVAANNSGEFEIDIAPIEGIVSIIGTATYGQTLTADTSSITPAGFPWSYEWLADDVTIPGQTGSALVLNNILFDANAGLSGKAIKVKITTIKASGAVTSSATVGVSKLTLTWSGTHTAISKTYDGTSTATVGTAASLTGMLYSENPVITVGTATFTPDANAANGKTVTFADYGISTLTDRYQVSTQPANKIADITKRTLTGGWSATTRDYDGTTVVSVIFTKESVAPQTADNIGAVGTGTISTADQGVGKTVIVSNVSLTGTSAENYNIPSATPSPTVTINPIALTVLITANNPVAITYGTAEPANGYTPSLTSGAFASGEGMGDLGISGIGYSYTNNTVTGSGGTVRNVGTYNILPIGATRSNTNYTVTFNYANGLLTVNKRVLTGEWSATDKTYDGDQEIVVAFTKETIAPQTADSIGATGVGTIDTNANVGTRSVTISDVALTGTSASNYTVPVVTPKPNATIMTRAVTITVTADDKAPITYGEVDPPNSYTLSLTTGTFADSENILGLGISGVTYNYSNKTVTGTGGTARNVGTYNITPATAIKSNDNYAVTFVYESGTLTVNARQLTGIWSTSDKVYDKTQTIAVSFAKEAIAPQTADTIGATGIGTIATNANVGTRAVTISSIVLTGVSASNYTVPATASPTATITARPIDDVILDWSVSPQTYDGTAKTPMPTNTYGAVLNTDYTIGNYADNTNAGTASVLVEATGSNYSGNVTLNFTINQRQTPSNGSDFEVSYDSISAETGKAMADPENPHGKGEVSLVSPLAWGDVAEPGSIKYALAGTGEYDITYPSLPTAKGTYDIQIVITGEGNFQAGTVVIEEAFKVRAEDQEITVGPDPLEPDPFIPDPDTTYVIQVFAGYSADIDLGGGKHVGIGNPNSPLTFTDDNEGGSVTFKIGPNQPKVIIVIDADITVTDNWYIGNASTEYLVVIEKEAEVTVEPDVVIAIHQDSYVQQGKKLESETVTYITLPDETIIGLVDNWKDGNKTLTAISIGTLEFINKKLVLSYSPGQTENTVNFIGHFKFQGNEDPSDVEGIRLMVYKNEGMVGEFEATYIQKGIGVNSDIVTIAFDYMIPDTYDKMVLCKTGYTSITMTNVTIRNTTNDENIYVGDQVSDIYFYAGDVNGDGKIDDYDIDIMRLYLGTNRLDFDFNKNGYVDALDLIMVESNYGKKGITIPESKIYYIDPTTL